MGSRKSDEMKQRLLAERDRLLKERDALDNQIAGLERAIALVGGDDELPAATTRSKRTSTKSIVLNLLDEVGTTGLNAAIAVDLANRRGVRIERGSVSSLLSRLKADSVVAFDGEKYRLPKYASKPSVPTTEEGERPLFNVVGLDARKS